MIVIVIVIVPGETSRKQTEEQVPSTVGGRSQKNVNHMQVVTSMQQYAHKSFEELRMEDYQRGNKSECRLLHHEISANKYTHLFNHL